MRCILAVDATSDPDFGYGGLRSLKARLQTHGLELRGPLPDEPIAFGTFEIGAGAETVSTLFYVKSNANEIEKHMEPHDDERVTRIRQFAQRDVSEKGGTLRFSRPYPHTATFRQWFSWERFEAYRLLGYQLGRTYLAEAKHGVCDLPAMSAAAP